MTDDVTADVGPLAFSLFATPVIVTELPALAPVNAELAALLLEEAGRVPSWRRANVGGWHSAPDLGARPHPGLRLLMRAIVDQVTQLVHALAAEAEVERVPAFRYGLSAWAMVVRHGHYIAPHDHGDVHWASAYYVDAGDDAPPPSGQLSLLDPRRSGRSVPELPLFPPTFDLTPRTGSLVLFPGWLQHHVHAYQGTRPRISISTNVTLQPAAPAG